MGNGGTVGKCIILTTHRTGSTLLSSLLRSHSQIDSLGEVFNRSSRARRILIESLQDPALIRIAEAGNLDPIEFSERVLWRTAGSTSRSVVVKIMYSHLRNLERQEAYLDYLQRLRGLRIIHLKRRNRLARYYSYVRAQRTSVWSLQNGETADEMLLRIDPEACRKDFEAVAQLEALYDDLFRGDRLIELFYEDLVARPQQQLQRVQDFLGVEQENLHSPLQQICKRSLQTSIVNYDRVEMVLSGKPLGGAVSLTVATIPRF